MTPAGPGPGGPAGVGVFGRAPAWPGAHATERNAPSGPASAAHSYGIWIDAFAGSAVDVHASLKGNAAHSFAAGILPIDSNGDESGLYDVIIGTDPLRADMFGPNGSCARERDSRDDRIDATMNDRSSSCRRRSAALAAAWPTVEPLPAVTPLPINVAEIRLQRVRR